MAPALRDTYRNEIDFTALALQYLEFSKKLKANGQLDFSDPEAVRLLTKSLLHRDFDLDLNLPQDRLCPPVPNRFNYILWIQDMLDSTSEDYREQYDPEREVMGLDIGTGASAIYPLMGCRQRPSWRFVGTDIDDKNIKHARENTNLNNLSSRIKILQTSPEAPLIPEVLLEKVDCLDFTMCNPPFYTSQADLLSSAAAKKRPPFSACTGAAVEMVTPGGEVAFTTRLIEESQTHRARIQWYTTMLGKLSSVQVLVERLRAAGCENYAVTEFVQGSHTRRWAAGWSWADRRPDVATARGIPSFPRHLLPFPSEVSLEKSDSIGELGSLIDDELKRLDLQWRYRPQISTGVGFAPGNVWSRQARRKRASTHNQPEGEHEEDEEKETEAAVFGFKISLRQAAEREGSNVVVRVRWLKGRDAVLFESFCGMLKRKVDGR